MSLAAEAEGRIALARWPEEVPLARALFLEYADWVEIDLCFQGFEEELAGLPGAYRPPEGGLWFARVADELAGVVAMRPFAAEQGVCEMKRLWIRGPYRGLRLGRRLALTALGAARAAGYRQMRLDSLPQMADAQRLYADLGFRDVTGEVADPHPLLTYMAYDLEAE